jgi:glycosyltransferase involved in cell wall biosynthesis
VGNTIDADFPKVLQEYYRVPRERIMVVSNGVDLEMFRPRGLPKEGNSFRVLYVGYVGRTHGANVVLEAIAALAPRIPGLQLVVVGPPVNQEERRWLMEAVAKPGLRDHVNYLGPQPSDAIPGLVEAADVCLHSFLHGLGMDSVMPIKVYEYLAMGRCVVASDLSGVRAIIRHEENGLLAPPADPQAMADAIYRIYSDPGLRAKLEANARRSIEHAGWARINDRVLQRVEVLVGAIRQGVSSGS